MITPEFENKNELLDYLSKNQNKIIAQKKAITKRGDEVLFSFPAEFIKELGVKKAINNMPIEEIEEVLKVKAVINTTNWLDSHGDVHITGLWDKSLQENKYVMHLQEHEMKFDKIISDGDNLKAYVQNYTWKQLGANYTGKTQALIFDSTILEDRNEYMYEQYSKGYVKNHSVGMQYVKMYLCINDEGYSSEFDNWNKYFPLVANSEDATAQGYFWAVTEAKLIEGSAVPIGSNRITPTLDNNMKAEQSLSNNEPLKDTQADEKNKELLKQLLNKF